MHIKNIPDYVDSSSYDDNFVESYFIQIWEGTDWSKFVKDEKDLTPSKERSIDIDLISCFEKYKLYGKAFIVNCGRDYWYKGKKYSIGYGSPTFTYGDLNHEYYEVNYSIDEVYVLDCTGFETSIEFDTPVAAASGYTTVNIEFKAESKEATQVSFQLQDKKNGIMASDAGNVYSENFGQYVTELKPCLAGETYSDWSTGNEEIKDCADSATGIKFFFQDANSDFKEVAGTVYVRKVWLSAKDKEDLIVFDSKNYNGGATSATGSTYYSYEITSGGVTYLFDKVGKLTGKADGSEIDDLEKAMESTFISITLDKDVSDLGDSGNYTSLIISGNEAVITDDDPDTAAILAESYKYTYENINKTKRVKQIIKRKRRLQRSISRKYLKNNKEGGYKKTSNIVRSNKKLLLINKRLNDIRYNHIHQVTTDIVNRKPKFITVEDLNVKGMMKNRKVSRAFQEECLNKFYEILKYTSKTNNIEFRVVNRFFPSSKMCHNCGSIKKDLKLSDRIYKCDCCGYIEDRDYNASLNLRDALKYEII